MEQYQSEEEQVEALRKWWDENGKSILAAVVIALAAGFGWQSFTGYQERQSDQASDMYQSLLRALGSNRGAQVSDNAIEIAEQIKRTFAGSTYAQFAGLQLAAIQVERDNLDDAEVQLRWVLGKADTGGDTHRIAQLRLARVLAANGDSTQALAIIAGAGSGAYGASYATAKGDILLAQGQREGAKEAYSEALALASAGRYGQTGVLEQKLQSLTSAVPAVISQDDPRPEGAMIEPVLTEPSVVTEPAEVATLDSTKES